MRVRGRSPLERPAQSFDVFDTCLVRTYLDSADLVYDCAERVLGRRAGRPAAAEEVAELAFLRLSTHRRLLGEVDRDEVRLAEVYDAMGPLDRWGVDARSMHDEELALERASCRPVAAVAAQVVEARAAGRRVLFLSDTWLPETVVRELLTTAGLAEAGDVVRASCEDGRSKWTGRMFEAVLAEQGLRPADLHHRGDDARTDWAVPRSLGVAATLVTVARPSTYERLALGGDGPRSRSVRSRLAGASRAVRLSWDDPPSTPEAAATAVGAAVAGPLLTAFVAWVLERAGEDGVARLLFVSRDGQVLLRVARALSGPEGPDLRYLHASRRSILLAALPDAGPAALEEVLPPPADRSPRRALAAVGVAIEDVAGPASVCGLPPPRWDRPAAGDAAGALAALLASPEVRGRVESVVAGARAGVEAYLGREGLVGSGDWALVDVGWNLRLQAALRPLTGRRDDRPLGYYLGARPGGVLLADPGPYRAFLLQGFPVPGPASPAAAVFDHHTVVEALLTPGDHGPVRGYRVAGNRADPVLGPGPDPARLRYVTRLHDAAGRYASEVATAGLLPAALAEARDRGLAAAARFLVQPDPADVAGLAGLRHADDVAEEVERPVVAPLTPARLAGVVVAKVRPRPRTRLVWKEGSLAASGAALRRAVALLDRPAGPRLRALLARAARRRG